MRVLSGWKEIATYLKRGVRTVQRWEHLGLPVHRPMAKDRSAVTALAHELDAWMAATPKRAATLEELQAEVAKLQAENEMLKAKLAALGTEFAPALGLDFTDRKAGAPSQS
jgi:hypothetical protein